MCSEIAFRFSHLDTSPAYSKTVAMHDAADLRGPVPGLLIQISLLEMLYAQVQTDCAEDGIAYALEGIRNAVAALNQAAIRVIKNAKKGG